MKKLVSMLVFCVALTPASQAQRHTPYQGDRISTILSSWLVANPPKILERNLNNYTPSRILKKQLTLRQPDFAISKRAKDKAMPNPASQARKVETGYPSWTISKEVHRISRK